MCNFIVDSDDYEDDMTLSELGMEVCIFISLFLGISLELTSKNLDNLINSYSLHFLGY